MFFRKSSGNLPKNISGIHSNTFTSDSFSFFSEIFMGNLPWIATEIHTELHYVISREMPPEISTKIASANPSGIPSEIKPWIFFGKSYTDLFRAKFPRAPINHNLRKLFHGFLLENLP